MEFDCGVGNTFFDLKQSILKGKKEWYKVGNLSDKYTILKVNGLKLTMLEKRKAEKEGRRYPSVLQVLSPKKGKKGHRAPKPTKRLVAEAVGGGMPIRSSSTKTNLLAASYNDKLAEFDAQQKGMPCLKICFFQEDRMNSSLAKMPG